MLEISVTSCNATITTSIYYEIVLDNTLPVVLI